MVETDAGDGFEWAIVEIFGHRRHAGRAREEERFGSKMLRIDIPIDGDPAKGWTTHFYGGAAIFSFALSDVTTVMKANAPYVSPYRLRAAVAEEPEARADLFGEEIEPRDKEFDPDSDWAET